jgi:hypothetical protein
MAGPRSQNPCNKKWAQAVIGASTRILFSLIGGEKGGTGGDRRGLGGRFPDPSCIGSPLGLCPPKPRVLGRRRDHLSESPALPLFSAQCNGQSGPGNQCVSFFGPNRLTQTIGGSASRSTSREKPRPFDGGGRSPQCPIALRFDPEPMQRSLAGMTAATDGGRPIISGRSSSRGNTMPERYAITCAASTRGMPT